MAIQVNIHGNNNGTIAETVVINNYSQQPSYPQPQPNDIEDVVPVEVTEQETERINDHQEDLHAIFPYFTDKATNTELEILTKECGHRYAATRVIDLLADWEGDITITKGYTMEEVYSNLLKFCTRYEIPFVKQNSFESAYSKRYDENRNKYCRIFK